MKTQFQVNHGQGPIEIVGDAQESILLLNSQPIQFSWFAEIGTTWRYHIATALSADTIDRNHNINQMLEKGIRYQFEFDRVVNHYEALFSNGRYKGEFYEIPESTNVIDLPEESVKNFVSFDYYGGLIDVSPTQVTHDENRVKYYQRLIKNGHKPTAVLLHIASSPMFYILDGHHKLYAYGRLRKAGRAIIFSKEETTNQSSASAVNLANSMGCKNESYLKSITMEKENLFYYAMSPFSIDRAFAKINLEE